MKAAIRHRYGSSDVVEFVEVEKPTARDDQVLISEKDELAGRSSSPCEAPYWVGSA